MTKTILHITSSLHGSQGLSSRLGEQLVTALQSRLGDSELVQRNVSDGTMPHLAHGTWALFPTDPAERTPEQRAALALSDSLAGELRGADALVLSVPMHNFGVPSGFKAWIDHIARPGVTFRYTSEGPEGLLAGKPVALVLTRGGAYAGTDNDHQLPWLRQVLGFVGLTDIALVLAENQGRSKGAREAADAAAATVPDVAALLAARLAAEA